MIRAILTSFVLSSLSGLLIASLACTDDDIPTTPTAAPTSVLEGVDIVKTIPPTPEGDEPEPLNQTGPRRGGVLAAPMSWCPVHDPGIDSALGFLASTTCHLSPKFTPV